ncbi:D-alanine--D-alanine ligase [Bordetella ansorpii]|uniref:D-alanine--D-alanine ligase n=1 Tax=Bordetella ansorpii TaxID=288768 RepID=A0A157MGW3_9BORD|nr:non-ribosomal peptide synthetase [Bordetella ansorpii]SAI08020.1 D-alanine--D-alanine ligase [Bordetella ansorpii]
MMAAVPPVLASAPLSFAQEPLWLLQSLDPALTAYNLPRALRIRGELDADALERALQGVIARHDTLRTRFAMVDGEPRQEVLAHAAFALSREDLSALASAEREAGLARTLRAVAGHVFDLARPPAIVATLVRLAPDESVLALCLHHIASDGASNPLLAADLQAAYAQALAGPVQLAPLAARYAELADDQRLAVHSGRLSAQMAYWEAYLGAPIAPLALPNDRPRPPRQTHAGALLPLRLPTALSEKLRERCREMAATPFVLLLAAWQVTLARLCEQGRYAIGVPQAGRHDERAEALIGCFATTQVYVADIASHHTLRDVVAAVRRDALMAMNHAEAPLEWLLSQRRDPRDPARNPLFQVLFGVQMGAAAPRCAFGQAQAEFMELDPGTAKFELSLDLRIDADGVSGYLEYNTDLFSPDAAGRVLQACERVLRQLAQDPDVRCGAFDLVPSAHRLQLRRWAVPASAPIPFVAVHERIARQARGTPDAVALVHGSETLRYAELEARANRLAHRLAQAGAGADTRVAVLASRSVAMVVGLLAVLKAGAAYVPFDPELPAARLDYMLADSGPRVLLSQGGHHQTLSLPPGLTTLDLDAPESPGMADPGPPAVPLHPEMLAYVIYTSGSTGMPKGAANRHGSLDNRLMWMQDMCRLQAGDVVLQKTPFGFDVSVWEFFLPLMTGATLAVADPGAHRDPQALAAVIERDGVTTAHFVPSMLQAFLDGGVASQCRSLRRVICSGEALPAALQAQTWQQLPWAELHNLYGPTEAAIDVTHWPCLPPGGADVPIGRPIANTGTHVLDADLNPVPAGQPGELYLDGIALARGYLGRAGMTAQRFVASPLGTAGGRLYRTGDRVRWSADGVLHYLGRADDQVKIRGNRIELGEIETVLAGMAGVAQAAALVRDGAGGPELAAYVVLAAGDAAAAPQALRAGLAQRLPAYMVPSSITVLQRLPLNASGKLDRKALPAPTQAAPAAMQAPTRDIEKTIARAWCLVLGRERVGLHDNFFDSGGHSLLVLRLQAELQSALGQRIPAVDLFTYPTVAALAAHLSPAPPDPDQDAAQAQAHADDARQRREHLRRRKRAAQGALP